MSPFVGSAHCRQHFEGLPRVLFFWSSEKLAENSPFFPQGLILPLSRPTLVRRKNENVLAYGGL